MGMEQDETISVDNAHAYFNAIFNLNRLQAFENDLSQLIVVCIANRCLTTKRFTMRRIYFLIFPALAFATAQAQVITFQINVGGALFDEATCVQQTADGGYIITGNTESGIGGSLTDVILIKTDSTGAVLWNKTYGSANHEFGRSVQQTSDGGYILAGVYSFGSGPQYRGFLIKTNANGDTLWTKVYGSANNYINSVRQTSDGGYIAAGWYRTVSYNNAFLLKVDNAGNVLWSNHYGGNSSSQTVELNDVCQTSDGGYVAAGWTNNSTSYTYLLKVNSSGDTLWSRTCNTSGYSTANAVRQTSDGGYILGGNYRDASSSNSKGAYLIKTDGTGNVTWNKVYGMGSTYYEIRGVEQTTDGGYVTVLNDNNANLGQSFLLKVNSSGNFSWCRKYVPVGTNNVPSVAQTTDGGFVMAGANQLTGSGSSCEIYLIKADSNGVSPCNDNGQLLTVGTPNISWIYPMHTYGQQTVSVGFLPAYVANVTLTQNTLCTTVDSPEMTQAIASYVAVPNPFCEFTKIVFNEELKAEAVLIMSDAMGREVTRISIALGSSEFILQRNGLLPGVYFYTVRTGYENFGFGKLIVE